MHLIFSAVLGAGGLLHSNKFAGDLGDYPENSKPQKFDFLKIDSLEDIMGGHAFVAFLTIIGGVFHICTKQFGEYTEFKGKGLLGAEAILSYSVVGCLLYTSDAADE